MLGVCWAVNESPAGLCVSFVIVSLVPLRTYVLPRIFSRDELEALDAEVAQAAPETMTFDPRSHGESGPDGLGGSGVWSDADVHERPPIVSHLSRHTN